MAPIRSFADRNLGRVDGRARGAAARDRSRTLCGRSEATPLRRPDAPGPARRWRRTPVHLQRHEPPVRRALAILPAVCVGLARGPIDRPTFSLATAVAASGAFPPFFAPLELKLDPAVFAPAAGTAWRMPPTAGSCGCAMAVRTTTLASRRSSSGIARCSSVMAAASSATQAKPATDWIRGTLRTMKVIDNQVRSLRKRLLIAAYDRGDRRGAYWGIRSRIAEFPAPGTLDCPPAATRLLAGAADATRQGPSGPPAGPHQLGLRDRRCGAPLPRRGPGRAAGPIPAAGWGRLTARQARAAIVNARAPMMIQDPATAAVTRGREVEVGPASARITTWTARSRRASR